jgi:molybdate transport system substrate-binding protein
MLFSPSINGEERLMTMMGRKALILGFVFVCYSIFAAAQAAAGQASVAVAANFTDAAKEIAAAFEKLTGHRAVLSFGSSGQLYTQITQHAPFEVFLSADDERPKLALSDGYAVADSRFTYAIGRIVLWSKDAKLVTGPETLKQPTFRKIAIANPAAAPYGIAAIEAMKALGVYEPLQAKIVQGNSIAQTYQFIDTGNAELGFVALAQVISRTEGSRWLVPEDLYTPIRQDAVLLKTGQNNEATKAFLAFLKGPEAIHIIQTFGYGTPTH